MIRHHEGVRIKAYRCPAQLWTWGVGHVLYPAQLKLPVKKSGMPFDLVTRMDFPLQESDKRVLSTGEIDDILRRDLDYFERGVRRLCPVPVTQGQWDALVSFAFNVGLGALQRSGIRQKTLRFDKQGAANEFLKWTKAGGKVLKGLINRRNDERALYLS